MATTRLQTLARHIDIASQYTGNTLEGEYINECLSLDEERLRIDLGGITTDPYTGQPVQYKMLVLNSDDADEAGFLIVFNRYDENGQLIRQRLNKPADLRDEQNLLRPETWAIVSTVLMCAELLDNYPCASC